jgi:predicted acyltransferase
MQNERNAAIDLFRGLAIFVMLPVNFAERIRAVPAWFKHAPDVGLTIADLVAPCFVFAIGLTAAPALRRRLQREGRQKTFEHVLKRSMALVGIGALFSQGESNYGFAHETGQWGTLQAIGTAVALSAPTLFLKKWPRLALALALLGLYQYLVETMWLQTVVASSHAGIQGSLSWAALMMLATVYADLYRDRRLRAYWLLVPAMVAAALALATVYPISKHRMSISFDLLVAAVAATLFGATDWLVRHRERPAAFLEVWGKNPLVLYCSHLFLLGAFLEPPFPRWHVEAPLWQALVQGLAFMLVLDQWARYLARRNIFISL